MGWLDKYNDTKHSNSEKVGKNLRPFDLQKAREGKPVCTRDRRKARILCYDFKQNEEYPILVAVENKDGKECALRSPKRKRDGLLLEEAIFTKLRSKLKRCCLILGLE